MPKTQLQNLTAIFFDFDGVLCRSVGIKTWAFGELYKQYGSDIQQQVIKYHEQHGGVSRYKKFEYYEAVLLGKPVTDDKINQLADQFAKLVKQGVIESVPLPGAVELLQYLKQINKPAHVISGTPDGELAQIVERKGWSDYFISTHGSPTDKSTYINYLCAEHGYNPANCVMVGDALTDYTAAKNTGTKFLGVVEEGCYNPFPTGEVVIKSLVDAHLAEI